jgi:hypothetical protein
MAEHFEDALISVWQQTLVQNAKTVELGGRHYFVKRTSRHRFRQVDFMFNGQGLRGLEQNPETSSRWAKLARKGKKVMQFLREGRTWLSLSTVSSSRTVATALRTRFCGRRESRFDVIPRP